MVYAGQALPGTHVAGLSLAGASAQEARRRLERAVGSNAPILLAAGDQRVRVRPHDVGYVVDLDATVEQTMRAGRGAGPAGLWSTLKDVIAARHVPLVTAQDRTRLRRAVALVADRIDRPPFTGALAIAPDALAVTARPPRPGRRVDRRAVASRLHDALVRRTGRLVAIPIASTPTVAPSEVEDIARAARAYLREPLRLTGSGRPMSVAPERIAGTLALEPVAAGRRVRLGVRHVSLAALVDEVARSATVQRAAPTSRRRCQTSPSTARADVAWRPRPAGIRLRVARTGRAVRREALAVAIRNAILAGRHRAALPVQRIDPAGSTVTARRVRSLIGTFTTYYEPGQPLVTNIQRIARAVDGTVIAPGSQFSLNAIAGPRTTAKGYVEAPFIADGKIVPSVGGGVSQFSTTAYNAAYFAGLQIDAHRPHSLFIDRYPAGREATLNYPDIDLVWTNDTDAPVLVRAAADASSVAVALYGDNDGRRVRAQTGTRAPVPGEDFTITVTRVVRYGDGRTTRQPFATRYDLPAANA